MPKLRRADGAGMNDDRIRAALIKLLAVVREEWDEWAAQPENHLAGVVAKRLCVAQRGGNPHNIATGIPGSEAVRCGKAFGILHPIEPAWVHYLSEATCVIEALEEAGRNG